jgi:hypothetical protein
VSLFTLFFRPFFPPRFLSRLLTRFLPRHRRFRACALPLAAAMAFAPALQAQTLKPGLWQIANKMSSANAETDQAMSALLGQVASLPPEQRKQLEAYATSQGLVMPKVARDGSIGVQTCITPDMAARKQIPTGQGGDCKSNNVAVAGGIDIAFTCRNPASSGKGRLSFISENSFTMVLDVTASARGTPEQVRVTSDGNWLGATCPASTSGQ